MIAYASRTGTKANLKALKERGWHLLVSATGALRNEGFPYALDNGAWTNYQNGLPFDDEAFRKALYRMGSGADWVAVPDIVAGGMASLERSLSWLPTVMENTELALIPVQDGMAPADVCQFVGRRVGLFLGGTTAFKEGTMEEWGRLAREAKCWFHVGRVNTRRRIVLCGAAGATSFDGTSASRYSKTLPMLDWSRRQKHFVWEAYLCPIPSASPSTSTRRTRSR